MIDSNGFRENIGIIIANDKNKLFWAKRIGQNAWQFPQGGINEQEDPEEALFRELFEEVGLHPQDVRILGSTKNWLKYRLPKRLVKDEHSSFVGQKQKWFLLRLEAPIEAIGFQKTSKPEFDDYLWVTYWFPLRQVVPFKYEVYRRALKELAPFLFKKNWRIGRNTPVHNLLET